MSKFRLDEVDHQILDIKSFIHSLEIAEIEAKKGKIVTLGVQTSRPETGYGYIGVENLEMYTPTKVLNFLEKPSLTNAEKYFRGYH